MLGTESLGDGRIHTPQYPALPGCGDAVPCSTGYRGFTSGVA